MPVQTEQGWVAARTLGALRRHLGWTVKELADRAGMSRSSIDDRLHGRVTIDTDDIEALATAFGVPASVLLLDAGDAIRWVLDNEPAPGWYAARDSNPEPAVSQIHPIHPIRRARRGRPSAMGSRSAAA